MIINDIEVRTDEGIEAVKYLSDHLCPDGQLHQMAIGLYLISMLDAILLELRDINISASGGER